MGIKFKNKTTPPLCKAEADMIIEQGLETLSQLGIRERGDHVVKAVLSVDRRKLTFFFSSCL